MFPGITITIFSILVWSVSSENQVIQTCVAPDGNTYLTNTTFITSDCLSQCVCTSEGHLGCVPLCPDVGVKCPIGFIQKEIIEPAGSEGDGCFCKKIVCKAFSDKDKCLINGRFYNPGEDFISEDCSGYCKCNAGGIVLCVSLCPPEGIKCQHDEKTIELSRKVPNSKCTCPTWRCLKKQEDIQMFKKQRATSKVNCTSKRGNTYQIGQAFVDKNCTLKCHCRNGGKITCQPLCAEKDCTPFENNLIIQIPVHLPHADDGQSNCSCPLKICEPIEEKCIVGDHTYKPGDDFVSSDCSGYCKCYAGGSVVCASLCHAQKNITCQYDEDKISSTRKIPSSNCTCRTWSCMKKIHQDKCTMGEHTYNSGDDFVSADCSGYCKCHPGGSVHCVSLCPPEKITCQNNEDKIESSRKISNSNCTCPTWYCVKKTQEVTGEGVHTCKSTTGKVYQIGQVFSDQNCTRQCHCEDSGKITCRPLCPESKNEPACPPLSKDILHVAVPLPDAEGKACSCSVEVCGPVEIPKAIYNDKCTMGEHTYNSGDDFVSADCSGYCKCHPGGSVHCVSLCPPEKITCQNNEDKIESSRKISNSNCTCPTWYCVKKTQEVTGEGVHTCKSTTGKVYQIGQVFSDQNCTLQCHCEDGGKITCRPLCPESKNEPACPPLSKDILHVAVPLPDAEGKACSCSVEVCGPVEIPKAIYNDKCTVGEHTYNSGDDFVSADCSGYCECHPGGSVHCVRLCPPEEFTCQNNEDKIESLRKIPNSKCTCPTWSCVKKTQEVTDNGTHTCTSKNGKIYRVGQVFSDQNCTLQCHCEDGGKIKCRPLCPEIKNEPACPPLNKDIKHLAVPLPDAEGKICSCSVTVCGPIEAPKEISSEKCTVGNHVYYPGNDFFSADCSGYCKCHPGGSILCVSLCPPEGITCQHNEDAIQLSRKIPNSNCSCPTWKCLKKSQQDDCIVGSNVYKPGETFISNDCSDRCKCLPAGRGVICEMLCPLAKIICQPDEIIERTSEIIPNSNCSCPKSKCQKKKDNGVCIIDGRKYKFGERFVNLDCTGYCKCDGPNSFSCVSLCPPGYYGPCGLGEIKVEIAETVLDSHCTCPAWKCVKESGNWTLWSNWTSCDAPCGGGLRRRYRSCGAGKCIGSNTETDVCNLTPCASSYSESPCGSIRMKHKLGGLWPRCNDDGFFSRLQCNPMTSHCWCVNKWGKEEAGSRLVSQKPQCKSNLIHGFQSGELP